MFERGRERERDGVMDGRTYGDTLEVSRGREKQMTRTHTHRGAQILPGCNAPQCLITESIRCMSVQELDAEWKAKGSPKSLQPGIKIAMWEKFPPWPFQKLKNMQGKQVGIIGVAAPMVSINDYHRVRNAIHSHITSRHLPHCLLSMSSRHKRLKLPIVVRCVRVWVSSGADGAGAVLAPEEHGAPHAWYLLLRALPGGDLEPRRQPLCQ